MSKLALTGGAVILLGGAAALPYYVGMKAEQSLRADHQTMAQEVVMPGLQISLASYQRGWLSSEAVTAIVFTPEGKNSQPLQLEIHHHISHLPNLRHKAIASATSEVVLPAELQVEASKVLNGQSPLTINTYIGLTGAEKASFFSPAFTTPKGSDGSVVIWKGLQGSATGNRDNTHFTTSMTMPGLSVTSPEMNLSFENATLDSDSTRGSYGLWFGTTEATLGSFKAESLKPQSVTYAISALQIKSNQSERGELTDGTGTIRIGKSTFDGVSVDSAVYDFEMRNIDTQTISELQKAIRQAARSEDQSQLAMVFMGAIPALLKAKPEFNIRTLEFYSSLGDFSGKLNLAFVGEWNDSLLGNPLALLGMIKADTHLVMSKSLVTAIAKAQQSSMIAAMAQRQGSSLSAEQIDTMAADQASAQLAMMEANGFLVADKGNYTSKVHFENGQLTVNDKTINNFIGGAPH